MMTTTLHLSLVVGLVGALTACADPPPASSGALTERDRTTLVTRTIDDAPGLSLVFTRVRDDGWRSVELVRGADRFSFHDNPALYMLDANGQGFGDRAVICGMSTPDPQHGTSMSITCAVADPAGLGPRKHIETASSAWLGDVCAAGDSVTLLYAVGAQPLDPDSLAAGEPCMALAWNAATGWDSEATPSAACSCEVRDGAPCSDPCVQGTGVMRAGVCDLAGLAPTCDDGDPATDDFCTGIPTELCYSVARAASE